VFLASAVVTNTQQQCLVLQVGLVRKADVEGEAVVAIMRVLLANIVVVLGHDFRGRLPVVEGEASSNVLLERDVCNSNGTDECLCVGGQVDLLDADGLVLTLVSLLGEVCEPEVPLNLVRVVLAFEGVLSLLIVGINRRGAGTDSRRLLDLQEVSGLIAVVVEVDRLGVCGSTGHARVSAS